jgi:uncharacterized membrane protein
MALVDLEIDSIAPTFDPTFVLFGGEDVEPTEFSLDSIPAGIGKLVKRGLQLFVVALAVIGIAYWLFRRL